MSESKMPKEKVEIEYSGTNPLINSGKEAIENYKKIAEENKKDVSGEAYKKVLRQTARILATTLPLPLLTACAACEKPPVVEEQQQEEGKGQETVPSETAETEKETVQEETPPVVEETPEKIEWEGVTISPVEGLKFDKGDFYFMEGNEYGGIPGEKAGVLVKDGLEVNGKMENAIGLDPMVIEFKEKEIFKETKERLLPILIDLTKSKDVKLQELNAAGAEIGRKVLAFNVAIGTEFLSPLSGSWGMFKPFPNVEDKCFFINWDIGVEGQLGGWDIYFRDAEVLAKMEKEVSILNPKDTNRQTLMETEVKLGDPLGKITSNTPLEEFSKSGWGDYQIVAFLKNKDRIMEVGSGADACKVFIFNQ